MLLLIASAVHELPAKPSFDAQMALADIVVERGGGLDDLVVLDVHYHNTPTITIPIGDVGAGLWRFFLPRTSGSSSAAFRGSDALGNL